MAYTDRNSRVQQQQLLCLFVLPVCLSVWRFCLCFLPCCGALRCTALRLCSDLTRLAGPGPDSRIRRWRTRTRARTGASRCTWLDLCLRSHSGGCCRCLPWDKAGQPCRSPVNCKREGPTVQAPRARFMSVQPGFFGRRHELRAQARRLASQLVVGTGRRLARTFSLFRAGD